MKSILFALRDRTAICILMVAMSFTAIAQGEYQIKGQVVDFQQPSIAYLYAFENGRTLLDSAAVKNGAFVFKGSVKHPLRVSIQVKSIRRSFDLFLENERYELLMATTWEGENKSKGGKEMAIQKAYEAEAAPITAKIQEASERYGKLPSEQRIKEGEELSQLNEEQMKIKYKYIQKYPTSLAILDMMRPHFDVMNFKELERMVKSFSPQLDYSNVYKHLLSLYEKKKAEYLVGQLAPAFTMPDLAGNSFSLASLRGKFVLVDFWASWCTPCRAANLQLKPLYEKYKNSGFEIVSISMDDKRNLWEEAVKKDGIPWLNVSELNGLKASKVSANYGVRSLPTVFLLDREGKVVAQNISKNELEMILQEQLPSE